MPEKTPKAKVKNAKKAAAKVKPSSNDSAPKAEKPSPKKK